VTCRTRGAGIQPSPRSVFPNGSNTRACHSMTKQFTLPYVVTPDALQNILAKRDGGTTKLRNLRVAETEKYAHVTVFLHGGIEIRRFLTGKHAAVPREDG